MLSISSLQSLRSEVGPFADDCTMFSIISESSHNEAVHSQIQQDLNKTQAWAVYLFHSDPDSLAEGRTVTEL